MIEGLEALERLMADYYEMCQDLGNNDDQYQRCNLTSERAIIEKELKALAIIRRNKMIEFDLEWELDNNLITKEEYNLLKEVCNDK